MSKQNGFQKKMTDMFADPETCYRPDLRWWLAEGLNTDKTLEKNVQQIHDLGFGAAEFLAMPEPGADSSIYGWGSEEWTADTQLIVRKATELGLGFSLTNGAHWATANLPDTYTWEGEPFGPDSRAASKELDYATILLQPGEKWSGILPYPAPISSKSEDAHGTNANFKVNVFQGVVCAKILQTRPGSGQDYAYAEGTEPGVLDAASLKDLTEEVVLENGREALDYTAPDDGTYALFVYWMHGTCQTASPSVATNYSINYTDKYGVDALKAYWDAVIFTPELDRYIRRNGRGEIYMDSLELHTFGAGGIFWGYQFKEEFLRRKGYDVTKYLPLITMDDGRIESGKPKVYDYTAPDSDDLIRKARTDYYSVLSDLYVENVLTPLSDWLHTHGMTLRAEPSYGANFEISTPAKAVDGIETESFAQTADIDLYRGLSGSANMYGRKFSSETGAVGGHNYFFNMDTWTCLCFLQFAEGVNRTVFHGYSAIEGSEEDTKWPGHEGMYPFFSERFSCRQPASVHYPEWTKMLGRVQKAMRQGSAMRDIAILRTDYFFISYGKPKEYSDFRHGYMMYDMAYFWKDLSLQQAGYTYDYFSPQLLLDTDNVSWNPHVLQPQGPSYKALVVYQEDLEPECANKLYEIAKDGLPLIFVDHNAETQFHQAPDIFHEKAASKSKTLSFSDEALQAKVAEIKALPNVYELDQPSELEPLLRKLNIRPRVEYSEPNNRILTASRFDREHKILYTFVYDYKFEVLKDAEPIHFALNLEGIGTPYLLDPWTGSVNQIGLFRTEAGRTVVDLNLQPGEARLILLDLNEPAGLHAVATDADAVPTDGQNIKIQAFHSGKYTTKWSDGTETEAVADVPEAISLDRWDIEIEDWNEGEKVLNLETKFGHTTREVWYKTKKTLLHLENAVPVAWKDLPMPHAELAKLTPEPRMDQVSGIGRYTCSFELPEDWNHGAVLTLASDGGGTVEVMVNGQKAGLMPHRDRCMDISAYLVPGHNTIQIEVTTTLTNRMRQRGYDKLRSGWTAEHPAVQEYGIRGVRLCPYSLIDQR
ncbi:MAG: hypothetical protein IJK56_02450 [Firmicutes bacterium]|nr:hypothetical protein [Bacillota bacterium]